jgi:hypothetical protein
MSPDLDKELCDKYPKIFADRYKSPQESCLAFGIECGDGWYDILDSLCYAVTYTYSTSFEVDEEDALRLGLKKNKYTDTYFYEVSPPQLIADQVKEKFGTLRFYYHLEFDPVIIELNQSGKYPDLKRIMDGYDAYFHGIVHMAETLSSRTCELSGQKGELHVSGGTRMGWYRTLNPELAKTRQDLVDREYVPVSMLPKEEEPL